MSEQPNPGEARGPAAMAFGVFYPKGYLVAVVEDEERANAAAADLRAKGLRRRGNLERGAGADPTTSSSPASAASCSASSR